MPMNSRGDRRAHVLGRSLATGYVVAVLQRHRQGGGGHHRHAADPALRRGSHRLHRRGWWAGGLACRWVTWCWRGPFCNDMDASRCSPSRSAAAVQACPFDTDRAGRCAGTGLRPHAAPVAATAGRRNRCRVRTAVTRLPGPAHQRRPLRRHHSGKPDAQRELPDALAVEMEGAAFAQVCDNCAAGDWCAPSPTTADDAAHVDFPVPDAKSASRHQRRGRGESLFIPAKNSPAAGWVPRACQWRPASPALQVLVSQVVFGPGMPVEPASPGRSHLTEG